MNKISQDKESRAFIIKDATLVILQKKVPEKKLVEFLEKHLETSKETAEKIVQDIKTKLIPFAKISSAEDLAIENQKEKYREDLLKKINTNRNIPTTNEEEKAPLPYYKKTDIADVEKNSENMSREGKNIITEEKSKFQKRAEENKELPQNTIPDTYREPVE